MDPTRSSAVAVRLTGRRPHPCDCRNPAESNHANHAHGIDQGRGPGPPGPRPRLTATARRDSVGDIREPFERRLRLPPEVVDQGAGRTDLEFPVMPTSASRGVEPLRHAAAGALNGGGPGGAIVCRAGAGRARTGGGALPLGRLERGGRLEVQRLRVGHGQDKPGTVECVGRDDEPELRLRPTEPVGPNGVPEPCTSPHETAPLSRPGLPATLSGQGAAPPRAHVLRAAREAAPMRGPSPAACAATSSGGRAA